MRNAKMLLLLSNRGIALTLSPTSLPAGNIGVAYSQTITASPGSAPYVFSVSDGSLPTGLSLNTGTGAITGTPTTAATSNFTISVTCANGAGSRAYSVAVTFDASVFGTVVLRLDASTGLFQDSAGLTAATADADPVGKWTDQSGSGNHATQATTGNKPQLKLAIQNGLPVIRFATDDYLSADALAALFTGSDTPLSAFIVQKYNVASATEVMLGFGNTGDAAPQYSIDIASTKYRSFRRDDASTTASTSNGTPDTGYHVRSHIFAGTTVSDWIDGTIVTNAGALNVGTITLNAATVGALRRTTVGNFVNGDIAAVIVYSSALSAGNRQFIERHLGARYGITVA